MVPGRTGTEPPGRQGLLLSFDGRPALLGDAGPSRVECPVRAASADLRRPRARAWARPWWRLFAAICAAAGSGWSSMAQAGTPPQAAAGPARREGQHAERPARRLVR